MNDITVVIPYRNERAALNRLLASLPQSVPVIVVDDLSETPPLVAERPGLRLIRRQTRGYFSGAVNTGLAACAGDVLLLNQDMTQVSDGWLGEIERLRPTYAAIGDGVMGHPAWPQGYVQGTVMFMRRDAITAVGGFNERDFPLWGATAEWQARACRKGFRALPMETDAWFVHERKEKYGKAIAQFVEAEPGNADWARRTPPLVSVIMACYNYGRYLADAVNSLRGGMTSLGSHPGQTLHAWECIIVDDCSTDDTPAIAQSLADAWQGIRYIRLAKNAGTAGAYNAGIKASFGRFFMPLSADDMLEPGALEAMYRIVEDDPGSVPYTDLQLFRDGVRGKVWTMKEYDFDAMLERNHVPSGIMAAKAAWQRVGGYPAQFRHGREDWAMAVALGRAGYCGVRIPEPLYLYRRAGQNRSATNGTAEWREHFVTQMREAFPDLYAGERPMACCGGSRRQARTVQSGGVKAASLQPGEKGMVLVQYIGRNVGKESWWGPVTGIRYEFGLSKPVGYVDSRDLVPLLDVVQGRKPVFQRYVQPRPAPAAVPPAIPEIVPAPAPEPVAVPVADPETADAIATATVALEEQPKKRRGRKAHA